MSVAQQPMLWSGPFIVFNNLALDFLKGFSVVHLMGAEGRGVGVVVHRSATPSPLRFQLGF
jgi:hypothetical protein